MRSLTCVVLLLFTVGCSSVRIARRGQWQPITIEGKNQYEAPNNAYGVLSPATTVRRKTVCQYAWGFSQRNIDCSDCVPGTLAEVKISNNLGYELISVLTLGFFQFQTVEWRCAKEPQTAGDEF